MFTTTQESVRSASGSTAPQNEKIPPLSPEYETVADAIKITQKGALAKQQHYVWSFYLRGWANFEGKVHYYLLREKKFGLQNPDNLAKRSFFYRSYRLTDDDLDYLDWLVECASSVELKDINRSTVAFFVQMYDLEALLGELGSDFPSKSAFAEHLCYAELMLGEKYHGHIENEAKPLIDMLRAENASFFTDPDRANTFVIYISQQMCRTDKMRKAIGESQRKNPIARHDSSRTGPIEQHIYANNIAFGIISEIAKYGICFLLNETPIPFITSDQPIINISRAEDGNDLALFYPIGPRLAIVLSSKRNAVDSRKLSVIEVETYNYRIYEASESQVYSSDESYLKAMQQTGKLTL